MTVYDVMGKTVMEINEGEREPGFHEIALDAHVLVSGIYFTRVHFKDPKSGRISESAVGKMILMK
jgi:hypothetical protein